jgi:hypothetical protein
MGWHRHRNAVTVVAAATLWVGVAPAQRPRWELVPTEISALLVVRTADSALLSDPFNAVTSLRQVDTIAVGVLVDIVAFSIGSSSCTRAGPVRLSGTRDTLRLRVFDYVVVTRDVVCTRDRHPFAHTIRRRFRTPGGKTIQAIGSQGRTLERTLIVVPANP